MIFWISTALAAGCSQTSLTELATIPSPAVFVLGERRGTHPDLARASRLVARLRSSGEPVTVALDVVSADKQPVLDRYADGQVPSVDLPALLDWAAITGFPYDPYQKLLTAAAYGSEVLAVGVPTEPKPTSIPVPIPPGYIAVLQDGMSGHYMPVALESRFVQMVTWKDFRIARTAIEAWNGDGYLVIVADRTHVEGGKGVGWQAQRLTDAKVHTILLDGPAACYDKDRYL